MVPLGNKEWTDDESGDRHDNPTDSLENGADLSLSLSASPSPLCGIPRLEEGGGVWAMKL